MTTIDLSSGKLTFGNAATDKTHDFDLMVLQLTIEQVHGLHNLKTNENGELKPTPEFLTDLAAAIDRLGFDGCTPTQAHQIWITASVAISGLKKNIVQSASLVSGITSTPGNSATASGSATTPTSPDSKPSPESTTA
jgi:alkanesulfonate monooxygenase SsuD/methylene tetrahydromethanopterin reductase-like flavin-dependent oxidoreductase (luciferase family)